MKQRQGIATLMVVASAITVSGCEGGANAVAATPPAGLVATFRDTAFNFATLRTFAMPDTIVQFAPLRSVPSGIPRAFDRIILDRVCQNFIERGFILIADPAAVTPDFVVLVGVTATAGFGAFGGYPWYRYWGFYSGWSWYPPGFDTTWGIDYPWFWSVDFATFDRGTVLVDLIPTASVNPNGRIVRSAWSGAANGLLDVAFTGDLVVSSVDEMFRQSPYLTGPELVRFDRTCAQLPVAAMSVP